MESNKVEISKREYTVTVSHDNPPIDYAKAVGGSLTDTTFADYARSVVSRALALQNEKDKDVEECKSISGT